MEIGRALPIQESLLGCNPLEFVNERKDPFFLTPLVFCASEIRDSSLIPLGQSLPR
jgi:hypothetical protein